MLSKLISSSSRSICRSNFLHLSSNSRFSLPRSFSTVVLDDNKNKNLSLALKPQETVDHLDKHIVGQKEAKKAVAIALRNRWRRHHLDPELINEVSPKNILMIGPTGCGKTEIARRIAKLSQAPFIKVEATKYTEVGFHGKDVDHIIKDLVDVGINMYKANFKETRMNEITHNVEEKILEALIGFGDENEKEKYRTLLKEHALDDREIEIDIPPKSDSKMGDINGAIELMKIVRVNTGNAKGNTATSGKKKMTVSEAYPLLIESETEKLLETVDVNQMAINSVEQSGIVFIDEIDKLISSSDHKSADASSEGVQRDLLPLIEGSIISTKYGNVNTEFILFIASGAFHHSKPSDLLAELQGRLPIRVTLNPLTEEDMYKILTEPVANLIIQQIALMKTEDVTLEFTDDAIREIAHTAYMTNKTVENIGARRLHTVIERVVEELSFTAPNLAGTKFTIDREYVKSRLGDMMNNVDLSKYIL